MSHIFLSYSSQNKDYAFRLADALRVEGFNVWIDNNELRAGDEWWESIVRALRAAGAFVVIMSPDARNSRWVQREVLLADNWEKPSFPLLLEGDNFELYVATQFYDVRDGSLPKNRFYANLELHVKRAGHEGKLVTQELSVLAPKDAAVQEAIRDTPARELSQQNRETKSIYEKGRSRLANTIDWCFVPAGSVRLKAGGYLKASESFPLKSFVIGKYPITNSQFEEFVAAGGYETRDYWTEAGWKTRLEGWQSVGSDWKPTGKAWIEPLYWHDKKFNAPMQPVVGISWYEALAYCAWLSATLELGANEAISLPTEQQWQRAAQGDDERAYPWGQDWDIRRCNSSVDGTGIGKTSVVTAYEGRGDSPFALVDMSGNVGEWCLTGYKTGSQDLQGTEIRVLRGGSRYNTVATALRCDSRDEADPDLRNSLTGFRCVLETR